MSHTHVRSVDEATDLRAALETASRFALDCEAAGFHRYSDRLCLLQITVGDRTWVVDPLAFDPTDLIRGPVEDPSVTVVMHGADFDLRLLSRDLGIHIRGLMDTQIQASLIAEDGLGLQSLLESRLGVKLSKKYQRADWANRPLTDGMLEYAADDTRYLERLTDLLAADVEAAGRTAWVEEECRILESVSEDVQKPEEPEDPLVRVKGARDLPPREATALREALVWRDEIARAQDRAIFRVVGDAPLVEAVSRRPASDRELSDIRGFPGGLAREHGAALIDRLRAVDELPDSELVPYPRNARRGPGRPPPELEAVVNQLKDVRNRAAETVGLPRGTLLSNGVLLEIAKAAPKTMDELVAVDGMRRWNSEVVGPQLLEVIRTL